MKEIGLDKFESQITPEAYLKELFAHTEDGVLLLSIQKPDENLPGHYRCQMSWTEADIPAILEEYSSMVNSIFETVKEAGADADSVMPTVLAAVKEIIPEEGEVQEHAWRTCRLIQLEAPQEIVQNEACKLMEALVLRRYCTVSEMLNAGGTPLVFQGFDVYQEGKWETWTMARMQTTGPLAIPVNVHVMDCHRNLQPGDLCCFLPDGWGGRVKVYPSEEALHADGCSLPVPFLTMGNSLRTAELGKTTAKEDPNILFTGKVLEVNFEPDADPQTTNCCLLVQTSELIFRLNLRRKRPIKVGSVLRGVTWLCGTITKA